MTLIITNIILMVFACLNLWLVWKVNRLDNVLEATAIRTVVLTKLTGKSEREVNQLTLDLLSED